MDNSSADQLSFLSFYARLHNLAEAQIRELGEIGIVEVTVSRKLFDQLSLSAAQQYPVYYAYAGGVPVDEMSVNIMGRTIIIKCGAS